MLRGLIMLMISSAGGTAMARAFHKYLQAREVSRAEPTTKNRGETVACWDEYVDAADAVAKELMQDNHHLTEGD